MGYMSVCIAGLGDKLMFSVVVWDMDMPYQLPLNKLQVTFIRKECAMSVLERRKI